MSCHPELREAERKISLVQDSRSALTPRPPPLRGANIGCDVVRSTIFAARRADVPAAGEGELNRV
jgi:hypothetical protein